MDADLTREQVLDQLEVLATIAHALVVEYLSVCCALGHDLEADDGGATTEQGRSAAATASSLALDEMFLLKAVNRALIAAGRPARLDRATSVVRPSGQEMQLAPPSPQELEGLLEREEEIAAAVDALYVGLEPAVTTDPVFEDDLLDEVRSLVVEQGSHHSAGVASLREAFGDVPPACFLKAMRRDTTDPFEVRLLDVSDRAYATVVTALREAFSQDDGFVAGTFRNLAVSAMATLDEVNRLLVHRRLLPPFTVG